MYFIDKQSGKGNDSFCFYEDDGVVKFANIDKDAIVWSYKILPLMWLQICVIQAFSQIFDAILTPFAEFNQ